MHRQADLIGLEAVGADGRDYGQVVAVENFGAGDLLEIRRPEGGPTVYLPFTEENVPEVEIEAGRIVIDPPHGISMPGSSMEGRRPKPGRAMMAELWWRRF